MLNIRYIHFHNFLITLFQDKVSKGGPFLEKGRGKGRPFVLISMFPKHNYRRILSGNCKNYRLLGSPARSLLNLQEQNRTQDSIFLTIILRDPQDNQANVGMNTLTNAKGNDVVYSVILFLSLSLNFIKSLKLCHLQSLYFFLLSFILFACPSSQISV